jgi:hypothetical protein
VLGQIHLGELVRAETERRAHGRIELAHRPPAELVDREVERADALDRSVGDPLRKCAVSAVERLRGGAKGAVRVRVLLEDAQDGLVRRSSRRGNRYCRPRRNAS